MNPAGRIDNQSELAANVDTSIPVLIMIYLFGICLALFVRFIVLRLQTMHPHIHDFLGNLVTLLSLGLLEQF